jgi:thymidylate synthase (FAD)
VSSPVFIDSGVTLVESNASDEMVVRAARVSTGSAAKPFEDGGAQLIGYLMRERHGSPFEHGMFTFHVTAPLFVAAQWMRHRAGHSYNMESGRYSEAGPEFYAGTAWRTQTGKPGHYEFKFLDGPAVQVAERIYRESVTAAWTAYQNLLLRGVAKEQARMVLPESKMTSFYWTCNPRSLMHFLSLRATLAAQTDIATLAFDVFDAFANVMPVTAREFIINSQVAP